MAIPNSSSSFSTLPIPLPRSPPKYPDLYGKHRKQAELQRMSREISFLEEELLSLDGLQPTSRCCKEVDDFVGTTPDPLIPLNRNIHRSFRFWKCLLRAMPCFSLSWICCSSGCSLHLRRPRCCSCNLARNWQCCCHPHCSCCCHCCSLGIPSCRPCCVLPTPPCCVLPALSWPDCSCSCVWSCPKCTKVWSCPKCTKVCSCPKCTENCCLPCYHCLSSCLCS